MTTRDDYIEKANDKLDVLNADLKKLEARADAASGDGLTPGSSAHCL